MEHRISLGTYERKQLAEAVDAYRRDKLLENIPNIMLGVAGITLAVGATVVVPIVGYQIGLGITNAIPFDGGVAAAKYEEIIANKIIRPLKGQEPTDPNYSGGELAVSSYTVTPRGVVTYAVPRWAQIVGVGWVYAQYVRGRGEYRTHGTARLHWVDEYPVEYEEAMAAERDRPQGTFVPPIGPPVAMGDFNGNGIPDEYDPAHYY